MTNEENSSAAIEAVEKAVEQVVHPQAYPTEGIDLNPAFDAIIDRLQPLRARLLKDLASATARNFTQQRADLVEFQSLLRAYDVLAGYVTADGRQIEPHDPGDPEVVRRREEEIDEAVGASTERMQTRTSLVAHVPLEGPEPRRPRHNEFAQARYRAAEERKSRWWQG